MVSAPYNKIYRSMADFGFSFANSNFPTQYLYDERLVFLSRILVELSTLEQKILSEVNPIQTLKLAIGDLRR